MKNLSDIFNECEKSVANLFDEIRDNAYKRGRENAIDSFEFLLTNKEIIQTYNFDDVLCNGNYDANFNEFCDYVRKIAEQLKEQK